MRGPLSRRSVLAGVVAAGVTAGTVRSAAGSDTADGRGDRPSGPELTAITGVTVIDATSRQPRRDQTVLLSGDRIVAAGPVRQVPVPDRARRIDGRGKFLIPGLVDMHVHSSRLEHIFPPLYLVNGVTSVREMGYDEVVDSWRHEVEAGTRLGPRWTIGSTIVDGSPSLWENIGVPYVKVADPAEARAAVRDQQALGADFVKTYTRLSRESFHAIAAESRRRQIPFLGHVPDFVGLTEASDLGLASIEHLYQAFYATSSRERELRSAVARIPIGPGEYGGWYEKMHPLEYAAARSHDRRKARQVFGRLARNQTPLTPTLSVHRLADLADYDPRDARLKYFPAELKTIWDFQLKAIYQQGRTPQMVAEKEVLFAARLELVAEAAAAGVPILAGTDVGASFVLPGFSLHEELALLVQAGLTPHEALCAATSVPARQLGRRDQGTIRAGQRADLVLLTADPLRSIENTQQIDSVVVRGRVIGNAERQRMLEAVAAAAAQPAPAAAAARCACHGGAVPGK